MGLCKAQCKMLLFCVKTDMEELHNFELAHMKKEEEEETDLPIWQLSGLVLSQFFFSP